MDRSKRWDALLDSLFACAAEGCRTTQEVAYQEQHRREIEGMLDTHLTGDQRNMVEEVLFEVWQESEQDARRFYCRGLHDCVWLLKHLGVLA